MTRSDKTMVSIAPKETKSFECIVSSYNYAIVHKHILSDMTFCIIPFRGRVMDLHFH